MLIDRVATFLQGEGINAIFTTNMSLNDVATATAYGTPMIAVVFQGTGRHAIVVDGVTTRQGELVVAIRDPWGEQYFEKADVFNQRFVAHGVVIKRKP